jgi:hypothetical protein
VVAQVIVVGDEGFDPSLELAGQIVVLQQDAVLERQMPALGSVQNLSQCAGRPATSSRCKSDTMKE